MDVRIIWEIVGPVLTGVIAWFASKKRHQAETDTVIIENSTKVIAQWKELAEKYESDLKILSGRLDELERKYNQELMLRIELEKRLMKSQG